MQKKKRVIAHNNTMNLQLPSVINGQNNIFLLSEQDKQHIQIIKKFPNSNYFNTTTDSSMNKLSITDRSRSRNVTMTVMDNHYFNTAVTIKKDNPTKGLLKTYLQSINDKWPRSKVIKQSIWYFPKKKIEDDNHRKVKCIALKKEVKRKNNISIVNKTMKNSSTSVQSSLEKQYNNNNQRESSDISNDNNELPKLTGLGLDNTIKSTTFQLYDNKQLIKPRSQSSRNKSSSLVLYNTVDYNRDNNEFNNNNTNDDYKKYFVISNMQEPIVNAVNTHNNNFTFKGDEVQAIVNAEIQCKLNTKATEEDNPKETKAFNKEQQIKELELKLCNNPIENQKTHKENPYKRDLIDQSSPSSKASKSKRVSKQSFNSKHTGKSQQQESISDLTAQMLESEGGEYINNITLEKPNVKSKEPDNLYSDKENNSSSVDDHPIARKSIKRLLIDANIKSKSLTTIYFARELTSQAIQLIYNPKKYASKTSQLLEHIEIDERLDIQSHHSHHCNNFMQRMKFLSQFYYREGAIMKARIQKKKSIIADYRKSLTKRFNFDSSPIFTYPKDNSFTYKAISHYYKKQVNESDIRLMRQLNKESLSLQSILIGQQIWNPLYLTNIYFDFYNSLLHYGSHNTSKNDSVFMTIIKDHYTQTTLFANFSGNQEHKNTINKTNYNSRTYENNTSRQNYCYIFSLITQNINGGRRTDRNDINYLKRTMQSDSLQCNRLKKKEMKEMRRYASQMKRKTMNVLTTATEHIKQLQRPEAKTLSEIDNEIINANLLTNPDFFVLPFKKKRKNPFSKVFYDKQKSYRLHTKLRNDYLNLQNAGFAGMSENFSYLKANNFLNRGANKKPEKDIIFSLVTSNKSNAFHEIQNASKLHEYINTPDSIGNTLLMYSTKNSNKEVTKFLLENGSNVNHANKDKDTPLHIALGNKDYKIASLLIENGANENAVNNKGLTPWSCIDNGL